MLDKMDALEILAHELERLRSIAEDEPTLSFDYHVFVQPQKTQDDQSLNYAAVTLGRFNTSMIGKSSVSFTVIDWHISKRDNSHFEIDLDVIDDSVCGTTEPSTVDVRCGHRIFIAAEEDVFLLNHLNNCHRILNAIAIPSLRYLQC